MTLTYYAAEKVVPNYNVMAVAKAGLESTVRYLAWNLGPKNIRVNAISAGPIKTLAARGVGDLSEMMRPHAERAPLHRNVDQLEVGGASPVPRQRPLQRHHRRNHLRRLRLQHHGLLNRSPVIGFAPAISYRLFEARLSSRPERRDLQLFLRNSNYKTAATISFH